MKETQKQIQQLLDTHLRAQELELVDLVAIPNKADRMVRARTVEEALDEFETQESDTVGFLVQVRTRGNTPEKAAPAPAEKSIFEMSDLPADEDGTLYQKLADETMKTAAQANAGEEPLYLEAGRLNVEYLLRNADTLLRAGDFALAANIYRAVRQSGERTGAALFGLARCKEVEGAFEEARKLYEDSIAYLPQLEAFERLAALLIRNQKDQEAAETLERALLLPQTPDRARVEILRTSGNCWLRADRPEKALEQYRKALQLDPHSDVTLSNLGALELKRGRPTESRAFFEGALQSNPKNDKALAGLGSIAFLQGDFRTAHDFLARSLDLRIQQPAALVQLVKCAYEIKSYATAARIVAEYVDSAPINVHLLYCLAGLRFHLGRMEDAKAALEKLIALQPEHSGAKDLLRRIESIGAEGN